MPQNTNQHQKYFSGVEMTERLNLQDKSSTYAYYIRQDQLAKEYQIGIESVNLLREDLRNCIRSEGVNQFVNCKELREKYAAVCKDNFHGMIFPEGLEPKTRNIRGLTFK